MKYFQILFFAALFFGCSPTMAQPKLIGEWTVDCPLQIVGDSMLVCDLCEKETFDYGGGQNTAIYGFELKIEKDTLFLMNGSGTHPVKYHWNKKLKMMRFSFKGRDYTFEMISGGKEHEFLLKEKDGTVLSFDKKKTGQ